MIDCYLATQPDMMDKISGTPLQICYAIIQDDLRRICGKWSRTVDFQDMYQGHAPYRKKARTMLIDLSNACPGLCPSHYDQQLLQIQGPC